MVSLRRRRQLGFCNGKTSDEEFSKPHNGTTVIVEKDHQDVKSINAQLLSANGFGHGKQQLFHLIIREQENIEKEELDEPKVGSDKNVIYQYPVPEIKKRKQHRRKHREDRETCSMRGVYFKNMKWQAAIKVEKKQIHLGTVNSQVEAAKLYDRAAFMCGREPNYELTEEEKQELSRLSWLEFLAKTRNAIVSKKNQRRLGGAMRRSKLQEDSEHELSVALSSSSDMEDDAVADL